MLTDERTMLRDAARAWSERAAPIPAFRGLRDTGATSDATADRAMAEMGWTGIVIPESHGGSNLGVGGAGLIVTELGRTLAAAPLVSRIPAGWALALAARGSVKDAWLPRIADGEARAVLAVDEGPRHDPATIATGVEPDGAGWRLDGAKAFVAGGDDADLFVVLARYGAGLALLLVPADTAGVTVERRAMADSRSHAMLRLDGVRLVADAMLDAGPADAIERVLDCARALAAAELLGLGERAFALTLDYLKTRVQFDRIIGSFQALQHRAVHLFTRLALLRSAVEAALRAIDEEATDRALLVSAAKALANDTVGLVCREAIQLHGGIGMTDEHDAGLLLKRARVLEMMWGGSAFHRDRFARLQGY